jgi:hypothetical protein
MQLAAHAMRDGPSDSDCRVRVQITKSGAGSMTGVVSVLEKARRTRQMRAGKTNESEPLLTCRKSVRRHRNQARETGLGRKLGGRPADRPSGGRHGDGVSPVQACVRNVGTCHLDAKGDVQVDGPTRTRVPMRGGEADGLVVATKPVNAGGAKEPALSGFGNWSTGNGRN